VTAGIGALGIDPGGRSANQLTHGAAATVAPVPCVSRPSVPNGASVTATSI